MIRKPWLLALTVLAVLVWNCSDDDPSGPPIGDPGDTEIDFDPNAGAGSVTGYLYLDSGGFRSGSTVHLIDDPAQAPDGTDPLVKTTVRVEMPDGAVVESGITDAFGRFSFQEIPIGAKQLAVYIEDDDTPDFEFEFSPVPDATTTLGRAHDVTRQEAIAIIESDFTSDDLVLGTLQPLEPGTLIYPAGFIDLENPTVPVSEVTTVDTPSWFFYIDPTFDAMFEHEVRYVLVDAETGATTWRDDVAWPPAINHVPFWNDDEQYFLYENVDPDDFEPDDIPADADFEDTSEVVQLPAEMVEGFGPRERRLLFETVAAGNDDTFVIILQGDFRSDFRTDRRNLDLWFGSKGIPSSQIASIDLSNQDWQVSIDTPYKTKFSEFNEIIKDRLKEGRKSTLIVFVTAHGYKDQVGFQVAFTDGPTRWQPSFLCLPESKACKLRVFLDMCYADKVGQALAASLPEHDYRIASSSDPVQPSYSISLPIHLRTGRRLGSHFTNAFLDSGNLIDNEITGIFSDRDGPILTEHPLITNQTPWQRSQETEPSWCVLADARNRLSLSPTSTSYLHNTFDDCPGTIGSLELTNEFDGTITVVADWDSSVVSLEEIPYQTEFTMEAGFSIGLNPKYNCWFEGAFETGIQFESTSGDSIIDFDEFGIAGLDLRFYGACCDDEGFCELLDELDCEGEFLGKGVGCDPNPCPSEGACCVVGECFVAFARDCNGAFQGEGTSCDPDPCPGACCADDGSCSLTGQDGCDGEFQGASTTCESTVCPQGACCFNDGSCQIRKEDLCNGEFKGDGTSCDPNPCDQPGACCHEASGDCTIAQVESCADEYLGDGTSCDPNPCPQPPLGACCWGDPQARCTHESQFKCERELGGTYLGGTCYSDPCLTPNAGGCCLPSGNCQVLGESQCADASGIFLGVGSSCVDAPCPSKDLGACCFSSGSCQIATPTDCENGNGLYQGNGVTCDPDPCVDPASGACCFAEACNIQTQADCESNQGVYQGDDTDCDPNPCPQPASGACCFSTGNCQVLSPSDCTGADGQYQGDGTGCDPNPCDQPSSGACCFADAVCHIQDEAACATNQGTYQGGGTTCDPNPCDENGACCASDGTCAVTTEASCDGEFQGSEFGCTPNPCPQPTGACCVATSCSIVEASECDGQYQGDDTACDPDPCRSGACCRSGECSVETEAACAVGDGQYQGHDSICDPDPCALGACCVGGTCTLVTQPACTASQGTFNGGSCDPNPCPGVCCLENGGCIESLESACDGQFQPDTTCDPNPCPQPIRGACCFGAQSCQLVTPEYCSTHEGQYKGDNTVCFPDPCGVPGACCTEAGCSMQTPQECTGMDGTYYGDICDPQDLCDHIGACCDSDGSCSVLPSARCEGTSEYQGDDTFCITGACDDVLGACCFDGMCEVTTETQCNDDDGDFQGGATECEPDPCSDGSDMVVDEVSSGVVHGDGQSELCLILQLLGGASAGALVEMLWDGEEKIFSADGEGVINANHTIFSFGLYNWEIKRISQRGKTIPFSGDTKGSYDVTGGPDDLPCSR